MLFGYFYLVGVKLWWLKVTLEDVNDQSIFSPIRKLSTIKSNVNVAKSLLQGVSNRCYT